VPYSVYVGAALDEFFTRGGAGRAGADFVTSPEVGSLFGALVARALDRWFAELGSPDPFIVVEAGAGRGRLARDVLRVGPASAGAMRYVMVERSAALRAEQREHLTVEPWEDALGPFLAAPDGDGEPEPVAGIGPIVTSLDDLPALAFDGVILANELLDNLPFDVIERTPTGWNEIRVGVDGEEFVEVPVTADESLNPAFDAPSGSRMPLQRGIEAWLAACATGLQRGVVVVIDYTAPAAVLATRGQPGWLRTYRAHQRGGDPLSAPGTQDLTTDVVTETLHRAAHRAGFTVAAEVTQAAWLASLGLENMVEAGRREWDARAHIGDLAALASRSRVTEAAALSDPAGLGAHTVTILTKNVLSGGR
jgi:NADH dehydrogenase [ubiquinone] 1 alpha subcomplex assembly factor 7